MLSLSLFYKQDVSSLSYKQNMSSLSYKQDVLSLFLSYVYNLNVRIVYKQRVSSSHYNNASFSYKFNAFASC